MMKEEKKQNLSQKQETPVQSSKGLYLFPNNAKMIWQGNKTLLVQAEDLADSIGQEFLISEGNLCYGKIKITGKEEVDDKKFKELEDKHRVKDEERKSRWGKKKLYAYSFDVLEKFEQPKSVTASEEGLCEEVKFLSEKDKLANGKAQYDFGDEALVEDFLKTISSTELVYHLSDQELFLKKILELVKQEPCLQKCFEQIKLFEPTKPMTAEKTFTDKTQFIDYLYGSC